MPRFVALVSGFGWHVEDLRRAALAADVSFDAVPFPTLAARAGEAGSGIHAGAIDLTTVDGVLVRMMPPGTLEQVVFRMDALQRLEASGVPVLNPPKAIETAVDKYLTLVRLEAAGVPVPETWVGESPEDALAAFDRLGRDVVVKPLFGSEGRGLVRVSDPEIAWRTFHALARVGSVLYLQRFIPHLGHDLRLFVVRDRVIGAICRHAPMHDWRTNIAIGGNATRISPEKEVETLSHLATRAVQAVVAGVDLLFDPTRNRWYVLEVNAVPGWRALSRVAGVDVAAALIQELRDARA